MSHRRNSLDLAKTCWASLRAASWSSSYWRRSDHLAAMLSSRELPLGLRIPPSFLQLKPCSVSCGLPNTFYVFHQGLPVSHITASVHYTWAGLGLVIEKVSGPPLLFTIPPSHLLTTSHTWLFTSLPLFVLAKLLLPHRLATVFTAW